MAVSLCSLTASDLVNILPLIPRFSLGAAEELA